MKDWHDIYKKHGIFQKEVNKLVVDAVKFLKRRDGEKILDLGCGTGRHTVYLIKQGFKVYGCDCSQKALDILREIAPEIELKKCDMASLPYENDVFDAVLCHQVIQHAKSEDIKKAVNEIERVLKNGGSLYLSVPSLKHEDAVTGEEVEPNTRINIDAIDGSIPHHYFSEEELRYLFNNFEIVKLEQLTYKSEKDNKQAASFILHANK